MTFWKEWRAGLGAEQKTTPNATLAKPERSVQPDVRPLRTKNHIHKKQQLVSNLSNLTKVWREAVGNAPYPDFTYWPNEETVEKAQAVIEAPQAVDKIISADINIALTDFATRRGILGDLGEVSTILTPLVPSKATLDALIHALDDTCQAHWKNPPNCFQLTRILKELPPSTEAATQQKLLKSYLRRWKLYLGV